jgi:hypothetical protein
VEEAELKEATTKVKETNVESKKVEKANVEEKKVEEACLEEEMIKIIRWRCKSRSKKCRRSQF